MIYESYYWKNELLKLANKIEKRTNSKRWWTESQHGTFEKEIMIGFYIVRKLIDAKKFTNSIVSTKISGKKYPNNGKNITIRTNNRFYEFYDFEKGNPEKFDLIFLCNQIVHSYIFSPCFGCDEEVKGNSMTLEAIYFNSDENRNKWLYEITINSIVKIFRELGNDYPNSIHQSYDPKRKDYKVVNKTEHNELPKEIENLIAEHENKQQKDK